MVTSNHVHLLAVDGRYHDVLPRSLKLVASRTGQEYNQRKNRKGAFREDRYHATAIENGEHIVWTGPSLDDLRGNWPLYCSR
jgi:putative transposase